MNLMPCSPVLAHACRQLASAGACAPAVDILPLLSPSDPFHCRHPACLGSPPCRTAARRSVHCHASAAGRRLLWGGKRLCELNTYTSASDAAACECTRSIRVLVATVLCYRPALPSCATVLCYRPVLVHHLCTRQIDFPAWEAHPSLPSSCEAGAPWPAGL